MLLDSLGLRPIPKEMSKNSKKKKTKNQTSIKLKNDERKEEDYTGVTLNTILPVFLSWISSLT